MSSNPVASSPVTSSPLTGCGTALITPFTPSGHLDEPALRGLVRLQIEEGIDFLVPCGTTGETPTLSGTERRRVVSLVLEEVAQAAGRAPGPAIPVIAGAGGNHTAGLIEEALALAELGVDGLLSVTPYYNKPGQDGLFAHYARLTEALSRRGYGSLPVLLYNVPGRTGVSLAPETVIRLAALPGIAGIKEASGSIAQIAALAIARERGEISQDFALLSGDDGMVLPLIALGGQGVISVVSNLVPGWMRRFTKVCLEGDLVEARRLQPRLELLVRACFLETNPVPVKAALAWMGRVQEIYRLPLVAMGDRSRAELEGLLERAGLERAGLEHAGLERAGAHREPVAHVPTPARNLAPGQLGAAVPPAPPASPVLSHAEAGRR